jgi:hypothetical protein
MRKSTLTELVDLVVEAMCRPQRLADLVEDHQGYLGSLSGGRGRITSANPRAHRPPGRRSFFRPFLNASADADLGIFWEDGPVFSFVRIRV